MRRYIPYKFKEKDDFKIMQIVYRDTENNLKEMLEYIQSNGNIGHSFTIIIDPKDEREKIFGWDGDGVDYIKEIKLL